MLELPIGEGACILYEHNCCENADGFTIFGCMIKPEVYLIIVIYSGRVIDVLYVS